MFGIPTPALVLLKEFGGHFQTAMHTALAEVAAKRVPCPESVSAKLEEAMQDWNPTWKSVHVLDPATRKAGARFLAGIACNVARPGASHGRAA